MTSWEPIADRVLNLGDIHELNIVNMSELLPFNNNIWRNTLITHSFRIGLVHFARSIDLVSHFRWWQTVITLYFWRMDSLAFEFSLSQPVVKRDMSYICYKLIIQAMNAFAIRTMLT